MFLLCFAILLAAFVYLGRHFWKWIKIVFVVSRIPGPEGRFLLGHLHYITNHEQMQFIGKTASQQFGPMFKVWMSVIPAVFLVSPEYIQPVLSSYKHTDKFFFYKVLHTFVGRGLITSNGVRWRNHRRWIQPSFKLRVLELFLEELYTGSQRLVKQFEECKQPIDITSPINDCILNILHDVVLGSPLKPYGQLNEGNTPFRRGETSAMYRLTHPWLLIDCIYSLTNLARKESKYCDDIHDFVRKIVQEKKKTRDFNLKRGSKVYETSFIDKMIDLSEKYPEFSEEEVVNETCSLMLAGQESVATAVTFCLYSLAKHPHIQDRVYKEVSDVMSTSDAVPTLTDLRNMNYLVQCIKETMRLYPSVPIFVRSLSEDLKLEKTTLPFGTIVCISPFATHRIPEIYHNPELFDPERFSPQNESSRHPYAYIPFSAGPRICIGYKFAMLEMEMIISNIIRNYYITLVTEKEEVKLKYRMTLRAKGGIWLQFHPRRK